MLLAAAEQCANSGSSDLQICVFIAGLVCILGIAVWGFTR